MQQDLPEDARAELDREQLELAEVPTPPRHSLVPEDVLAEEDAEARALQEELTTDGRRVDLGGDAASA
jgi:hypothetical protein